MKKLTLFISLAAALMVMIMPSGCHHKTAAWNEMDIAENLIETQPDTALSILSAIDKSHLGDKEERARYALLMSMALDKNYIDTTSFAVLQPAIDYYLKHGTPDEKLRTLYYQSCIYRNRSDDGNAMASCIEALDLEDVTDTLVLARTLVGQGILYHKQYKLDEFAENNLRAATLYCDAGNYQPAIRCYAKALNETVILRNKSRADSIVKICLPLIESNPDMEEFFNCSYLSYLIKYGTVNEFLNLARELYQYDLPNDTKLDIARGYASKVNIDTALSLLDHIDITPTTADSLKYYAVVSDIHETARHPDKALDAYKKYMYVAERFHVRMFSNDLLFAEKKHQLEISNFIKTQKSDKIIKYSLFAVIFMMAIAGIIIYRYYKIRTKRMMAEQENLKLKLEKHVAELELNILRLEKSELESERNNLKILLQKHQGLDEPVQNVIKHRLNMLNSLLAKEISDNESHAAAYTKWIEHIRKNKEEFLDSTRIALTASYPAFMKCLETCGLTDDEIKYVCLYAIGLKGKEVGEYMQLKRHYNISSAIRKKLGIDEHETNIGLYIRRHLDKPANTSFS
ncbi:MAG: hypothetical protein K2L55_05245 [Muribaculaceae bacterium]|nr:hypothetical protein [Muribaculaceae bacterium]